MTQPNDNNNPDRKINSEDFIRHSASCVQQHVVPEALTMYHPSARTVSPRSSSRRTPPSRRRASPLIQRTRCAFGPTGSTTSTCRRGPTRCGRTRRPARLETAAARGCGRVVLRRRLGAPRRRVPRTPREAPATGAGARRRPRGTVGRRRVSECVCAFDARSEFVQKGRDGTSLDLGGVGAL